jgi:hypothetical protein
MKKVLLLCALLIGVAAAGVQIHAHLQGATLVVAAPALPPPDCFPDCAVENN